MPSLALINEFVVFASPKRLFYLQKPLASSVAQENQRALREWKTGIDMEDKTILGCTGGKVKDKASVLIILLDDKHVLLLWVSHGLPGEPAPVVSYSITSTYRKASAAIISNGILVVSDRFGSIYSHNLVGLESDKSKHNDVSIPIDKAVAFTLAEPVVGRCASITSLATGLNEFIYFSDRDGVIVETRADNPHNIYHIWSTKHTYLEQVLPWYPNGVLALGDLGISYCSCSQKKLFSKLIISNNQLDSQTISTTHKCIGIARRGLAAFAAVLTVTVSSRTLSITSLTISKITMDGEEMSAKDIFTHGVEIHLDWEGDASALGQASRSKIIQAYDIISLQDSVKTASGGCDPLFLDSLGTLFCINNESIVAYPKILNDKVLSEWACSDRVVMEHARRQVKL